MAESIFLITGKTPEIIVLIILCHDADPIHKLRMRIQRQKLLIKLFIIFEFQQWIFHLFVRHGASSFELATYKKLGTSELTWENYAPLCRVNTDAAAITVGAKWAADNGITDLPGFIDYCKAHPGEVQMGGSSNASVWHIAGGYLMSATGIDIQMITYQEGAATAVQNAAGGFIQGVTVSLAEARSFIESGDLICLGVMDEERNPVFPDVPTCKEQGYDITYYTQRGMAAPLGVDDAIMTRLEEACAAAIEDPDFVTFMNNNGQAISYLDAQGYADYLKQAAVDVAAAMDAVGL